MARWDESLFNLCHICCIDHVWIGLCNNVPLNNDCSSPLLPISSTFLIKKNSSYHWYYYWQVFSALSDGDWYRQNLWAGEKRATVPRWVPVTLSEHGGERKIDFDISHILFFQTALEIVIILNNGDCRKARESSVSSNLILIYVIKIQIIIGWKVKSSSWSNRSLDLEKLTCVVVFNSSTFC